MKQGHNRVGGIAVDQLKSIISRVEKLEEERAGIAADIREVIAEARGSGFDVKAIRAILKLRKQDASEREETETILSVYLVALGMAPEFEALDEPAGCEVEQPLTGTGSDEELYPQAVAVVVRDQKASTSYVQRCLQIGYNRAAELIERMERDGIIGPANHVGKREVLRKPEGEAA